MTDRQQQLLEDFSIIGSVQERLGAVVDRARQLPPLSAPERIDAHRVPGCVSQVWLVSEQRDGRCHFRCDAGAPLVCGLVTLLYGYFSNTDPRHSSGVIQVRTCE